MILVRKLAISCFVFLKPCSSISCWRLLRCLAQTWVIFLFFLRASVSWSQAVYSPGLDHHVVGETKRHILLQLPVEFLKEPTFCYMTRLGFCLPFQQIRTHSLSITLKQPGLQRGGKYQSFSWNVLETLAMEFWEFSKIKNSRQG